MTVWFVVVTEQLLGAGAGTIRARGEPCAQPRGHTERNVSEYCDSICDEER